MINLLQRKEELDNSGLYGVVDLGPIELFDNWDLDFYQQGRISDKDVLTIMHVRLMRRLSMKVTRDSIAEVTGWSKSAVTRSLNSLKTVGFTISD